MAALSILSGIVLASPLVSHDPVHTAGGVDRMALVGGTVHTMLPGETPRVATVLIEDGEVVGVGEELALPPGTEEIDLTGKHVVPGLIDALANFDGDHDALYSAAGIALVRDIGGDRTRLLFERDPERRRRSLGPDLLTAGVVLDGDPPSTKEAAVLREPMAADALLPILFDENVDFLSTFRGLELDVLQRVVELAHENELLVWGPVPRGATWQQALDAGLDGVHFLDGFLPADAEGQVVPWPNVQPIAFRAPGKRLAADKTPVVPMLFANARRLQNQSEAREFAHLLRLLGPDYELWWKNELAARMGVMSNPEVARDGQRTLEKQLRVLADWHASGVPLLPGSGSPQPWLFPGQALHQELALWVQAGVPAEEVLRSATHGAAELLGVGGRYGSIQPGALATLIVCANDPREDLATLMEADTLVVRGVLQERADLEDRLAALGERMRLAREEMNAPLEVSPPPVPPEATIVLEGLVESVVFDRRLSTERFRVVRLPGERVAFLGHVVYAKSSEAPPREMLISQLLEKGQLQAVEIEIKNGEDVLRHAGLWRANKWATARYLNGRQIDSAGGVPTRPICAEAGSITTFFVLGQAPLSERFPVMNFKEGLEIDPAMWSMELDDKGQHQVRTHLGRIVFRFDERGAPDRTLSVVAQQSIRTNLLEWDAFGGPGFPLPEEIRGKIAEIVRAAEAASPGEAAQSERNGEPSALGTDSDAPATDENDPGVDDEGN